MSRKARIVYEGRGVYHCVSRVVDRRFIFNALEKQYFVALMRRLEGFTGCQVLTHCVMGNHFHVLLEVPESQEVADGELIARVAGFYGKAEGERLRVLFAAKGAANRRFAREERALLLARMHDLSVFMKELKQGFTQWYNRRKKRRGTLWEERFRSVLVENIREALGVVAEYIDLNPVRAGMVQDPKGYRWCGYGAAVAGDVAAMKGMRRLSVLLECRVSLDRWLQRYLENLFYVGEEGGARKGIDAKAVRRVIKQRGVLSKFELLRCRVRYFSDGVAIGSRGFVEEVFESHRDHFGKRRKTGRRRMRLGEWGDVYSLRDLQVQPVSISV